MATWPDYIVGPLDSNLTIQVGSSTKVKEMSDGRRIFRRMGSGAPDRVVCQLLIPLERLDDFKEFYERDLNLGLNWITSPTWVTYLGYLAHSVRFFNYPMIRQNLPNHIRVEATFLIQATSNCPADTTWPEVPSS